MRLSALEQRDNTPLIQQFGFSSNPPADTDVLLLFINGDRSNGVVAGSNHIPSRPTGRQVGETTVFNNYLMSAYFHKDGIKINANGVVIDMVTSQGLVHVTAPQKVVVDTTDATVNASNSATLNTARASVNATESIGVTTNAASLSAQTSASMSTATAAITATSKATVDAPAVGINSVGNIVLNGAVVGIEGSSEAIMVAPSANIEANSAIALNAPEVAINATSLCVVNTPLFAVSGSITAGQSVSSLTPPPVAVGAVFNPPAPVT